MRKEQNISIYKPQSSQPILAARQLYQIPRPHRMPGFHRGRTPWSRLGSAPNSRMPRVEIIEWDEEIILRAEVPGIDKHDLDVSLADNIVTIRYESRHEQAEHSAAYHYSEISRDPFTRAVVLPEYVDVSYTKATLIDGVLELRLLKAEQPQQKKIDID